MNENEYDIAVIGAGCAGAMAALESSKHSAKAVIIERKHEIGVPVKCAECLCETVLDTLNISKYSVENKVDSLRFFVDSKEFYFKLPVTFCVLDKSKLQKQLIEQALKKSNVELLLAKSVIGLNDDFIKICDSNNNTSKELKARIIIACDGIGSLVARLAGVNTAISPADIAVCAQHTVITDEDINGLEIHIDNYPGYGWVFPKGNGIVNAGLGILGGGQEVIKRLEKFLTARFRKFNSVRITAGCVPSTVPNALYKNNVILAGDAGRLVNPLGGGGIQNALLTGKLAGCIAGRCIEDKLPVSCLKAYEDICKAKIYPRLHVGYKLRKIFAKKPSRLKLVLALLSVMPKSVWQIFINSIYYRYIDEAQIFR